MKLAQVTLLTESGEHLWDGSLLAFAHDNAMSREEVSAIIAEMRAEQAPVWIGGGASPSFMLCL